MNVAVHEIIAVKFNYNNNYKINSKILKSMINEHNFHVLLRDLW